MRQIINNKDLKVDEKYVYIDNNSKLYFVIHEEAKFQNEEHKNNYLASQGAIYILRNLEDNNFFDLHQVDYLENRYKIYPIESENIGFILKLSEFANSKTNQKLLLKHFYGTNR